MQLLTQLTGLDCWTLLDSARCSKRAACREKALGLIQVSGMYVFGQCLLACMCESVCQGLPVGPDVCVCVCVFVLEEEIERRKDRKREREQSSSDANTGTPRLTPHRTSVATA